MKHLLGIDIGGTHVTAALITPGGDIIRQMDADIGKDARKKEYIDVVKNLASLLITEDTIGIGIACPGPADYEKGIILETPNLPISNTPLKEILEKEFSLPVMMENDGNCFVLGEAAFGAERRESVMAGFTLGTGIGGGIAIEKEILRGLGNAGELGHMTIQFDGIRGNIKNQGAAEEYASIRGIMSLAQGTNARNPKELAELARQGDKKAQKAYDSFGRYLGIAMSNVIEAFNPGAFVLGGSISGARDLFMESTRREMGDRVDVEMPKIYFSENPRRSGLLGAIYPLIPKSTGSMLTENRPWGSFTQYTHNHRSTVKIISVKAGEELSLQSHMRRDELWIALDNDLIAQVGDDKIRLEKNQEIFVPRNAKHRMSAERDARFLEISFGSFDENDETRYEDKYGRK